MQKRKSERMFVDLHVHTTDGQSELINIAHRTVNDHVLLTDSINVRCVCVCLSYRLKTQWGVILILCLPFFFFQLLMKVGGEERRTPVFSLIDATKQTVRQDHFRHLRRFFLIVIVSI